MLEPAVIIFRLIQYAGAMVLLGSSAFFLYALPRTGPTCAAVLGWPRRLLTFGALALISASLLGLAAQTSILAGSIREGLKYDSLSAVVTTMAMGPSTLIRATAAGLALGALFWIRPGRGLWLCCALLGTAACASFAWMGHGAATNGAGHLLHTAADISHAIVAALWTGALAAFLLMLCVRQDSLEARRTLHHALRGFAGIGSGLVAVIVATGLINSWFLVGPSRLQGLVTTPYGRLLVSKLILFGLMLGLAAANRFRLTPALARSLDDPDQIRTAVDRLRRSLFIETLAAFVILALVAWLGALAPVSAQ